MTDEELEAFVNENGQRLFIYLQEIAKTPKIACMIAAVAIIHIVINSSGTKKEKIANITTLFDDIQTNINKYFSTKNETSRH